MATYAVRVTWLATDVYSTIIRLEAPSEEKAEAAALELAKLGCHLGAIKWPASDDARDHHVQEVWQE
jgi:hypothetical protein